MHAFQDPHDLVYLRWSVDPIILATYKDLVDSPEADAMIQATTPAFVGNARETRT